MDIFEEDSYSFDFHSFDGECDAVSTVETKKAKRVPLGEISYRSKPGQNNGQNVVSLDNLENLNPESEMGRLIFGLVPCVCCKALLGITPCGSPILHCENCKMDFCYVCYKLQMDDISNPLCSHATSYKSSLEKHPHYALFSQKLHEEPKTQIPSDILTDSIFMKMDGVSSSKCSVLDKKLDTFAWQQNKRNLRAIR